MKRLPTHCPQLVNTTRSTLRVDRVSKNMPDLLGKLYLLPLWMINSYYPHLQNWKLELKEILWLVPGHTISKWQKWNIQRHEQGRQVVQVLDNTIKTLSLQCSRTKATEGFQGGKLYHTTLCLMLNGITYAAALRSAWMGMGVGGSIKVKIGKPVKNRQHTVRLSLLTCLGILHSTPHLYSLWSTLHVKTAMIQGFCRVPDACAVRVQW